MTSLRAAARPHIFLGRSRQRSRAARVRFRRRTLVSGFVIIFGLVVGGNVLLWLVQLGRLPVFASVAGMGLGLHSAEQAQAALSDYEGGLRLRVTAGSQTFNARAATAGIVVDTEATIQNTKERSGLAHIPMVQAWQNRHTPKTVVFRVDEARLQRYVAALALPARQEAVNATITIPSDTNAKAAVQPEKAGSYFEPSRVVSQIQDAVHHEGRLEVAVAPTPLAPLVTTKQLGPALDTTNTMLARQLTLLHGSVRYRLQPQEIRRMVSIVPDSQGLPSPVFDRARVQEVLQGVAGKFYVAPQTQHVTTRDGVPVTTTGGAAGQALSVLPTAEAVATALEAGRGDQVVSMASVAPPVHYTRTYSPTSTGLAALLKDYAASHGGTFRVATMELGGERSASHNGGVSMAPASMYKLFLAYAALKQVDEGRLSLDTATSKGSVGHCINRMIVVSDNPCATALLDHLTRPEVDRMLSAAGFGQTSVNGAMRTTASDIAKLLLGVEQRSLLSSGNSDYLLGLMRQQIYRSGIPAGSQGSAVANKVGFMGTWNHDGGIVYAPQATYVLVVMTTGTNFAAIKDLSNQVYKLYNP